MKKLFILLFSILMAGELEVDGDLKVVGNVQVGTIDSLEQIIEGLQTQLVALLQGTSSLSGVAEHTSNTSWIVPDGVNRVYAEIWGCSGSGGGAAQYFNGQCGGGGGAGGYVRVIFPVTSGEVLEINVSDENNIAGFKRENGTYIVYATVGSDGEFGHSNGGMNGSGGSGGSGFINEGIGIIRNGNGGGTGGWNCNSCSGGSGGQPIQGSLASLAASGGGGSPCNDSSSGSAGGSGYIYMVW